MANTYYDSQLTAQEIESALEAISGVIVPANNGKVLYINNGKIDAKSVGPGGAVLESLSVTQNGDYYPGTGVDGYDEVHVNVSGGSSVNRSKQNSKLITGSFVKEGRIGGFNTASALWQPVDASGNELNVNWSLPFVIHVRFKLTETKNAQALFGCNASNVYFVMPTIEIRSNTSFWFAITNNGSSWTNDFEITSVPIVVGNEYEIKCEYDGTDYSVIVTDGTNTASQSVTPSGMYYSSSRKIAFGNIAKSNTLYANGVYFDPDDTYIESNSVLVWGSKMIS